MLTYPGTTIPSQAFSRALQWIKANVAAGAPWPDAQQGLAPPPDSAPLSSQALATPGAGAWLSMGPHPLDMSTQASGYKYGLATGRINAVAVDPTTASSPGAITAYAGAAAGGLWKSTTCCGASTAWTPLWDADVAATQAAGAIEIDPNDHNIVYVGTGDFDGNDQFGEGIMKTTDGGRNWTQLAADVFTPFARGTPLWRNQNVGAIKVDPNNSANVLAGTAYDLYISRDGGRNWTRCPFGANPTDPTSAAHPIHSINRISGILLDAATSPTTAYVAVGHVAPNYNGDNGVYKGVIPASGCPALSLITTGGDGWPTGLGDGVNGATNVGRIRLGASRGNAGGAWTMAGSCDPTKG